MAMTLCGAGITPDLRAHSTKKRFLGDAVLGHRHACGVRRDEGALRQRARLSAGTFSNSVVTAAHWAASASRPARRVAGFDQALGGTCPAGQSAAGSSTATL
jgi:hypothetical protein